MKKRSFIIYCSIYALLVVSFAIYWIIGFPIIVKPKGDEVFVFGEILLAVSYVFVLLMQLVGRRFNWLFLLTVPAGIALISFLSYAVLFFIAASVTLMDGTPPQLILLYSVVNLLVTFFILNKWIKNVSPAHP